MISPMPEMVTGITNLFILLSAFGCMLWLRKFENVQLWQALYIVVTLCGVMGFVIHFYVFSDKTEQTLWVILHFLLGASLTLLSLASINQCVGHPTWQATLATILQGVITVFFMVKAELANGSFNYPAVIILAFLSMVAVAVDCIIQVRNNSDLGKLKLALPGVAIMVLVGVPCMWSEYCIKIGSMLINQSAVLHLAIAAGLPFICAGTSALLLHKQAE